MDYYTQYESNVMYNIFITSYTLDTLKIFKICAIKRQYPLDSISQTTQTELKTTSYIEKASKTKYLSKRRGLDKSKEHPENANKP